MASTTAEGDGRITLIVSDLHVGGGAADRGDDHVYQKGELAALIRAQLGSDEGKDGRLELIFNGDFFEFAQTAQEVYTRLSDDLWCSETESCDKLKVILDGHPDIFDALKEFSAAGNLVTLAAGNHDVDLVWPAVQQALRERISPGLRFELGKEWYERYGGKLQFSHGHIPDPANTFKHWGNPVRPAPAGAPRLEMCAGTLFMVKFVNLLEATYPFADNLQPVTKLISVLMREDRPGFRAVAWMFSTFAATSPISVLGDDRSGTYGELLLMRLRLDRQFAQDVAAALKGAGAMELVADLDPDTLDEVKAAAILFRLLGRIDAAKWHSLFDNPAPPTMGSDPNTLGMLYRAKSFGRDDLRKVAAFRHSNTGASVIVMGHTHQPDIHPLPGGSLYFNLGSWTRYLELEKEATVTLEQLRDESAYPYELNFLRVEPPDAVGTIRAKMHCFATNKPTPTAQSIPH